MSRIFVNFSAVQSQTARLRSNVSSHQNSAKTELLKIKSSLESKDGATNASCIQSTVQNARKVDSAVKVMTKMLSFISGSAEQMRREDARLSTLMRVSYRNR